MQSPTATATIPPTFIADTPPDTQDHTVTGSCDLNTRKPFAYCVNGFRVYNRSMNNAQSYPATVPQMLADLRYNHRYDTNDALECAEFLAGKRLQPWHKVTQQFRNSVYDMLKNNNFPTYP